MKLDLPLEARPRHVAIIMDGNGRWATQRGLARTAGHKAGADAMRRVARLSSEWGVEALTLYAFSIDNWKRPKQEVDFLLDLLRMWIKRETHDMNRRNIRVRLLGDPAALPADVRAELAKSEEATRANTGMTLSLAINYGGRDEIVRAVQKIMRGGLSPEHVTEQSLGEALDTAGLPDVDLLIRTSEIRTSGFLPWQTVYAEMVFHPGYWPDFDEAAYAECLHEYARRQRRFGGVEA